MAEQHLSSKTSSQDLLVARTSSPTPLWLVVAVCAAFILFSQTQQSINLITTAASSVESTLPRCVLPSTNLTDSKRMPDDKNAVASDKTHTQISPSTVVTNNHEQNGTVRGAMLYMPAETLQKARASKLEYLQQAKWFLRSWEETVKYLQYPDDRIDVLIVIADGCMAKAQNELRRWNCTANFRTERMQPSSCRLVGGFVPLAERRPKEVLHDYRFGDSIECVLHSVSVNAVNENYDKLLRTDLDTFLTPRFASWEPDKFIVGKGSFCFDPFDTCDRIHNISDQLDLSPPKGTKVVDNVGSTWYGDRSTMIDCSQVTMDVLRYLWENEFNATEKKKGGWPHWHAGVALLYAGNIAINHCTAGTGFEKKPDMVDAESSSSQNLMKAVHIHTWQRNDYFSKLVWKRGGYKDVNISTLDINKMNDYAMFMAWDGNRDDWENHTYPTPQLKV